jgi:uncharacterized protein YcfL
MKKMTLAIFAVAVIVLSGCQNTVNTVENKEKSMRRNMIVCKNVSTDAYLRDRLLIDEAVKSTLPSGLTMAQVTVRSNRVGFWSDLWSKMTGAYPYKISYRFNWLDESGMEVQTAGSVWKRLDLMPGETRRVQSVAPNPKCKDFMLSLKEGTNYY